MLMLMDEVRLHFCGDTAISISKTLHFYSINDDTFEEASAASRKQAVRRVVVVTDSGAHVM